MSTTNAILRNSIATLEEEIDRLATMRIKLVNILDEEDIDDQPVRKSRKATTKASTRKVKASKNGNSGESRKDQIVALLDSGMVPSEVANELGIAPQYVYHVRRNLS